MIQGTVNVHPLGQAVDAAVDLAIERLRAGGVLAEVRAMHTEIAGDEDAVFAALQDAFRAAAARPTAACPPRILHIASTPRVRGICATDLHREPGHQLALR